jgi:hypothetical protein
MKVQIKLNKSRPAFAPALEQTTPALGTMMQTACRLSPERLGSQHWRLRTLLSFAAFGVAALAVALPNLASARTLVPLISFSTNKPAGAAGRMSSASSELDGASLIYVDSSLITYPSVLPAQTIAGPAGPDVQVNDPSLDHIEVTSKSDTYGWASPDWEFCTQSETTLAADGSGNIVVSYNSSAGIHVVKVQNAGYFTDVHLFSAYSVSHDGGQTWRSGFIAPSSAIGATAGDGVVAADRAGNFYYASLGALLGPDEAFHFGVLVGKSTDHGDTFAPAQFVAVDPGRDKEWMAVGPDPAIPSRDNVYVTWTSFDSSNTNATLVFSRSTDGGATWSPARTIFAYTDDGVLSGQIQASNPTVDKSNGRLYVPFLHYDHINGANVLFGGPDFVRILVSDDGGNTFYPLAFNVPGAPNPFVYPVLQVGTPSDCGLVTGTQVVIKQGPDVGGGIWGELYGFPRFVHCVRLPFTQPTAVAQNGRVVIAFNASTSDVATNPTSPSRIIALYSKDAGRTWFPPFVVAPATTAEPQHFKPAAALAPNGNTLYVGYYVQQSNEQVRTEMATLQLTGSGLQLLGYKPLSSVAFDLEPNNVPSPIPSLKAETTVNFDYIILPGYSLGEYMGVATDAAGNPMAAWGDSRNSWVSPADGYYPGTHPQTDVFFVRP